VSSDGKLWRLYITGALGAMAFFTKQSTAAVSLALLIDRLWARRFREAAALVAGGITPTLLILVPLWLRHEPFLANFTLQAHVSRDWASVPAAVVSFALVSKNAVIPMFLALLGMSLTWTQKKSRGILLATALAWLSNVAAIATTLSGYNYFILPWFLTMLFVPAGLRQLERWAARSLAVPSVLFSLAMVTPIYQRTLLSIKPPGPVDATVVANLDLLSDLPYLELRSRRPQLLEPSFYSNLAHHHAFSDAQLLQRVDVEEYDLVLISGIMRTPGEKFLVPSVRGTPTWAPDLLNEIALHYRPLCEIPGELALVPRDRQSPVRIEDMVELFHEPCIASSRLPQLAP
jgi:hypothetical protein